MSVTLVRFLRKTCTLLRVFYTYVYVEYIRQTSDAVLPGSAHKQRYVYGNVMDMSIPIMSSSLFRRSKLAEKQIIPANDAIRRLE